MGTQQMHDLPYLAHWGTRVILTREPDLVLTRLDGSVYLNRWHVIPRNPYQNVYLHFIMGDDDDRALHDHPWSNTSVLLAGSYREITDAGVTVYKPGDVIERHAEYAHRLELIDREPCMSLFFTGPVVREWGFHCPHGWVQHDAFELTGCNQ